MDNLFDVVNHKMFTIFSREDRRSNYDLLSTLYDLFIKKQNIERDDLLDDLTAYVRSRDFDALDDEEGQNIVGKSPRDIASQKIRQFKKSGWLEEDNGQGFTTIYSLTSSALSLLETFRSMIKNKDNPLEYTGYFYVVYNILVNFNENQSKALLEQVFKNSRELFNSLQGLNSSIKHFIEGMLQNKNLTPDEVLETFLFKYQDQVMLTVFNNLKTKDNPNWYTDQIVSSAKKLRYEKFESIVANYISSISDQKLTSDKYNEISNSLAKNLDEVISRFEEVDEFIRIIDNRNTKFHHTTLAKLDFLMNEKRDIDGLVVKALKSLKFASDNEDMSGLINVFSTQGIDDKSLYSYTFNKEKVTYVESIIPEVSDEEVNKGIDLLFEDDNFSKQKINNYALNLLSEVNFLKLEDIEITDFDTVLKILMMQLYSNYDDVDYELEFSEDFYKTFGYQMESFLIRRKQ